MKFDPIALAIPFFFILIGIEVAVMRRQGHRFYRFADSITDLSCGIGSEVIRVFLGLAGLLAYTWVYDHFRVFDLAPYPAAAWIIGFFGFDFFYYWFHRLSHEINALWAMHVVHHQSQDYNLAVALRQSWFQGFAATPIYFPLAVIGLPPLVFAGSAAISLLYQFWIHTQTVGKLPRWYEAVMNTPSHHRVHHGINPEYIDRNHAGILIIWDRMFGTFEEEKASPVFGLVKPYASWNPVWANFDYWKELWDRSVKTSRLRDKIWVWFANPEWNPADLGGPKKAPPVEASAFVKWDTEFPRRYKGYVNFHFLLVGVGLTSMLLFKDRLPLWQVAAGGSLVILTTAVWGGLFEGKSWARPAEWLRHGLLLGLAAWAGLALGQPVAALAVAIMAIASAVWFSRLPRSA